MILAVRESRSAQIYVGSSFILFFLLVTWRFFKPIHDHSGIVPTLNRMTGVTEICLRKSYTDYHSLFHFVDTGEYQPVKVIW